MSLPSEIQSALKTYDGNKGFWRRLLRRDQAAIRALRRLNETDQANHLILCWCFIENKPKDSQESYKVYRTLLNYLASLGYSDIPEVLNQLYSKQLLNLINLKKLNPLKRDHFRKLSTLFSNLNDQHLLTQLNFDNIVIHLENTEEKISEMLSSMLISVKKLNIDNLLTQENLNCLLKKPLQANNIANILIILNQNGILTSKNCIQLYNEKNELLLANKAYGAIWHQLENYLPDIADIDERQLIFDHLMCLTQKEGAINEIDKYIGSLTSEASKPARNTFEKFSTAPTPRIKSRSMINILNLIDRPGTL